MLRIPVQSEVTDPRSVAVTVTPCPYCGTHEEPEDRDGVISCPNCGYPLTQEVPLIDEWEMLIAHEVEPLDEAARPGESIWEFKGRIADKLRSAA